MNLLVKYKKELFILLGLIVLYFALRLPNLTLQPIFADEAIYIRWAQVMKSEPTLRFLPLSDGKTPLFMWAMIPLFKIFNDPLFAGRFLSLISGFFTLLGVFFLSKRVFNLQVALWASLLYTIAPYTVFFDRMALVDSMLAAFTVWVVFFAIWLVKTPRLDVAMFLGYLLGGTILTKTPGLLNILMVPVSIIGFKRIKEDKYKLVRLLILWSVAIVIALIMYNLLRLGPEFHKLSSRNADYVFSPTELIGRPLDPFIPHFNDIADWFPKLLTWPILIVIVTGIFYLLFPLQRLGVIILLWVIIPLVLNMAFLKTFTARYLLTAIPLLLIIGGFGVTRLLSVFSFLKSYIILLLILPLPFYSNYYLLTNPEAAPLPQAERNGYLENWTAGYGFKEIAAVLIDESKKQKVVVATEGFFGTLPDGLYIYLDKSNIAVVGSTATISAQLRQTAEDQVTFFVGNKKNLEGSLKSVRLIKEFPKAKPKDGTLPDATVLYQVLP